MSLDLNVYVKQIDDEIIPKWIERMNQFDMECEIHPDFSFNDHSGFLPFKVKLKNPKNQELKDREFISGFEFYKDEFDLQKELESLQSKKSFVQKLLNRQIKKVEYANDEIDSKLESCKLILNFNWGSHNSLELRMSTLSSAIISELTNGICCYPADDIWYENKTIVEDAYKELIEYENSLRPTEWKIHEFKGWSN
ncbi:MAG: hypothetical protein HRT69_17930 [Flavobacteriaceae bacterium]|nr:hypothetical protein [Flavobacteriaceae bacterium]